MPVKYTGVQEDGPTLSKRGLNLPHIYNYKISH
jgi:hypothetical protein